MKSIKSQHNRNQHNRNLIYLPLVMRMKVISLATTMIQRVNDLEAFVKWINVCL